MTYAFVPETGEGLSNSNSYCDVAFADDYLAFIAADSVWSTATTTQKQASLVLSTRWLDSNFSFYSGVSKIDVSVGAVSQALSWPRFQFFTSEGRYIAGNTVPDRIKEATALVAAEHLSNSLLANPEKIKMEAIYRTKVQYSGLVGERTYSYIKQMLREYGCAGKAKSATVWRA